MDLLIQKGMGRALSLDFSLCSPNTHKRICPSCGQETNEDVRTEYFSVNITHNLGAMAKECGLYEALWRPEELGYTTAKQLAPVLKLGLRYAREYRGLLTYFNPPNGWGNVDVFTEAVGKILEACIAHPEAVITVSR